MLLKQMQFMIILECLCF